MDCAGITPVKIDRRVPITADIQLVFI